MSIAEDCRRKAKLKYKQTEKGKASAHRYYLKNKERLIAKAKERYERMRGESK